MSRKLTDAQRKALLKRAYKNHVAVWESTGSGVGHWRHSENEALGDEPVLRLPDERLPLIELEQLIEVAASVSLEYSHATWTGVGCSGGYVCATDRYRAYSLCVAGAPDVHLTPALCRTLAPLMDTTWWKGTIPQAWSQDGLVYVYASPDLLVRTASLPENAHQVVSTVRKVMPDSTVGMSDSGVSYPNYRDHVPYQTAMYGEQWVALPDPVEYGDVRRAYLEGNLPTVVLDGRYAAHAAAFTHGNVMLNASDPADKATYSSCTVGGQYREALLMPVRL